MRILQVQAFAVFTHYRCHYSIAKSFYITKICLHVDSNRIVCDIVSKPSSETLLFVLILIFIIPDHLEYIKEAELWRFRNPCYKCSPKLKNQKKKVSLLASKRNNTVKIENIDWIYPITRIKSCIKGK